MSGRMKSCSICKKEVNRSDNLKRHERICKLKRKSSINHNLLDKILNGTHRQKAPTAKDDVLKVNLPDLEVSTVPKPKVKKMLIQTTPKQQFLPSSEEGLKEKLRLLYAEFIAGNTATKPQIFEILEELCRRGVISDTECENMLNVMDDCVSDESSETSSESATDEDLSETSDSESASNDLDFYQLVESTVENLTRTTRKNLQKALKAVDEDISEMVYNYLTGEEDLENVLERMGDSSDEIKVKLLLKSMKHTRNRITKVLETLRNTEKKDIGGVLEHLNMHDKITDQELQRLSTSAHDISNYAKAIQGAGMWV